VRGELWAKLITNCAYNALSAITQLPYGRRKRRLKLEPNHEAVECALPGRFCGGADVWLRPEFDPQPFHLDEAAARRSIFGGLTASSWHTAAVTMRLLVETELKPAGGKSRLSMTTKMSRSNQRIGRLLPREQRSLCSMITSAIHSPWLSGCFRSTSFASCESEHRSREALFNNSRSSK
jgi:hypothetical protein